jgi:hypothetical protein
MDLGMFDDARAQSRAAITEAPGLAVTAGSSARDVPLGDLDSKGYVIVRSFLTEGEARLFERDCEAIGEAAAASYGVRPVSAHARQAIDGKLHALARAVERHSSVRVNVISSGAFGSAYFTTEGDIGLNWHQDSVSYYAYQNHHDYLNFYIPVVKPVRDKSNLCIVPFDVLEARSPEVCAKLRGRGATRFVVGAGKTIIHDNAAGSVLGKLPYELDELAVAPPLDRGDLLLLRGDVIHRTEDTDTRRVAASIRMMNGASKVRRAALFRGGSSKAMVMTYGRRDFGRLFDCFTSAGRDELTIDELARFENTAAPPRARSALRFATFLLWNKLLEGVFRATGKSSGSARRG